MKLVFVYNANVGIAAAIMDSIHKTLSPATYACSLCAITYGAVRMDPAWKAWLKIQHADSVFYHRDDFLAAYPDVRITLPAILTEHNGVMTPLLSSTQIAAAESVDQLIVLIEERLTNN